MRRPAGVGFPEGTSSDPGGPTGKGPPVSRPASPAAAPRNADSPNRYSDTAQHRGLNRWAGTSESDESTGLIPPPCSSILRGP